VSDDYRQLFTNFLTHRGAAKYALFQAWSTLGLDPPLDFTAALEFTNGGEGFVGQAYFRLYSVEEMLTLNAAYQVQQFAPGLVIIGSNGGGEAFGFDTRRVPTPIVQIPFIPMDFVYADVRGYSFLEFLNGLANTGKSDQAPIPRINMAAVGKEAHQKHPLAFGGSPTDPNNQVLVPSEGHAKLSVFWNGVYQRMSYR
jgi:hypothetical protein